MSNIVKTQTTTQSYQYSRPVSIRSWRNDVSEALYDAGMEKVAERWGSCSQKPLTRLKAVAGAALPDSAQSVFVCSGNHHHDAEIYSQTCDLRICPECARRHSARLVHRYLPKMLDLMHSHHRTYRFRHIVLTLPYPLTDPDIRQKYLDGFKQAAAVMDRLMSEECAGWKSEQGYLIEAEFGEEGKKLHYHIIHYGKYIDQAKLSREWSNETDGAASVVWIRGFPYKGMTIEETLREVLKYATKFYSQDETTGKVEGIPAHLMPLLAMCLDKTRRVRSAGVFYNLPEPDRANHSCETCGSAMIAIPIYYFEIYCNTGTLPGFFSGAKEQAGLLLKPADKSSSKTSGISPPVVRKPVFSQESFKFLKYIRRSDSD